MSRADGATVPVASGAARPQAGSAPHSSGAGCAPRPPRTGRCGVKGDVGQRSLTDTPPPGACTGREEQGAGPLVSPNSPSPSSVQSGGVSALIPGEGFPQRAWAASSRPSWRRVWGTVTAQGRPRGGKGDAVWCPARDPGQRRPSRTCGAPSGVGVGRHPLTAGVACRAASEPGTRAPGRGCFQQGDAGAHGAVSAVVL